jgi:hypothetical protein
MHSTRSAHGSPPSAESAATSITPSPNQDRRRPKFSPEGRSNRNRLESVTVCGARLMNGVPATTMMARCPQFAYTTRIRACLARVAARSTAQGREPATLALAVSWRTGRADNMTRLCAGDVSAKRDRASARADDRLRIAVIREVVSDSDWPGPAEKARIWRTEMALRAPETPSQPPFAPCFARSARLFSTPAAGSERRNWLISREIWGSWPWRADWDAWDALWCARTVDRT